jgi:hypothetical protein
MVAAAVQLLLVPLLALLVEAVLVVPMERARPAALVAAMPLVEGVAAQMAAVPVKVRVRLVVVEMVSLEQVVVLLLQFPGPRPMAAMQQLVVVAVVVGPILVLLHTPMAVRELVIQQAQVGHRHQTVRRRAAAAVGAAAVIVMPRVLALQVWLAALAGTMEVAAVAEAAAGHPVA